MKNKIIQRLNDTKIKWENKIIWYKDEKIKYYKYNIIK